jgi:hypothetical protein
MKRTRHQFAPAVPVQQVIDRAVAGRVPDRFLDLKAAYVYSGDFLPPSPLSEKAT